ncbi:hypothetical protein [Halobacteriovorax sp. YZS-1-1]|uniref:hypothetical protein n=1 Tax=unclassified Halobacteriovorax TaxID=2639665 RepID=UPI00399AE2CB
MKKFASFVIVVAIIATAYLLFQKLNTGSDTAGVKESEVMVVEFEDRAAPKLDNEDSDPVKVEDVEDEVSSSREGLLIQSDEELDKRLEEKEEEFDRLEEQWLSDVKDLFLNELQLTEREYKDYLNMREGLFSDKIAAFEDMHDQLEAKYGENYTYNPTEEEMAFDREIQKKYDELLLRKIGKEAFIKYLELRDRTNEKILESTKQDDAALLMEF